MPSKDIARRVAPWRALVGLIACKEIQIERRLVEPGRPASCGVVEGVSAAAAAHYGATWFVMEGGRTPYETMRGSQPGVPFPVQQLPVHCPQS